jgi:hypothetical protein
MRPEYEARRKIIRECMSLPKDTSDRPESRLSPSLRRRWSESRPVAEPRLLVARKSRRAVVAGRYCCFFDLDTGRNYVRVAGFFEVRH